MKPQPNDQRGPLRAANLGEEDRHELSNGNTISCAATGGAGARGAGFGFEVIDSDPAVGSPGVDAGLSPAEHTLRAPDVAVGVPAVESPLRHLNGSR